MRHLRESRGLTQLALATICKLDRTFIGGIERGQQNPSLECIVKIAKSLGVPVARLVAGVDEEGAAKTNETA